MKKHFNFKSMYRTALVALCLMTVGVGNVWGDDSWYELNNSAHIYFNDYTTNWVSDPSSNGICFLIGRDYKYNNDNGADVGSRAYRMSHIANTKLWYKNVPSWGTGNAAMYQYIAFRYAPGTTGWDDWAGGWDWRVTPRASYDSNTKYSITKNYDIVGKTRLFLPQSSSSNTDMNIATELTKYTAYLRVKYDENRTGTYGDVISGSTTWPHGVTFDFTGTYMTSASASAQSTIYSLTSNGWDSNSEKGYDYIPVTGEVRFELKGIDTGFELAGWAYADDATTPAYTTNPNDVTFQVLGNTNYVAFVRRKQYTINLANMEADEAGTTSVTVKYGLSDNMTSAITPPEKAHYDFGGYFVRDEETEELTDIQLIDADGNWVKDVEDYTGSDGDDPTWVHDYAISLYAKWTETAYTITPSVSPAGAGSVNTVTDAHLITPSSTITANPANAAWIFDYWEYGTHVGKAGGDGNAITVTSDMNSTITAHFKPRYELVGSYWESDDERGMPGWSYDGTGVFTFNSFTALGTGDGKGCDLSCSRTLEANTTYKFQIHDRVTGNHGYVTEATYIGDGDHLLFNTKDQNVMLAATGAGTYTFRITNITEDDGKYYPTVSVERPHEVNFGQKYQDIDGTLHAGTTGGTAAATAGGDALTSGDYVTYNTSVTHTATAESGYTFAGWWSSDAFEGDRFSDVNPMTYAVTSGDNTYAKFVETSTSVTLANDGHGKVQIGGADATSTACGVTTTRELTAVPNEGYKFSSWSKSGDDITLSSSSTNPTTLRGQGAGATSGQTVTANFVERYSIKGTMNGEAWGTTHTLSNIGTNASSKDTCYVTMTLPANTTYEFAIYDEQTGGWLKNSTSEVFKMTYTNHTNWGFGTDKTVNCGITTAGKGTYKFIFNITDQTVTVIYPNSYQVNYGTSPSVGGSVTAVDGDDNAVPNGGYVVAGGSVTYTAAAASGYTFVGWCNNDSYGDTFNTDASWTHNSVAATSNSYAKFKSTNFVIYRSGDKAGDPRAAYDDVESFDGGTISEVIELRMEVHELDKWYSLYLPYNVDSVCVYDVDEAKYYKMQPYFRKTLGGKLYAGHYIIRTPELTDDSIALSNFGDWRDPSSSTFTPSGNIPYIIQWHNSYFEGKYVSFFGAAGQSIASSFSEGEAPKTKNWVTVHGNNSMKSGSVVDAYTLDGDEIWVRPVDKGKSVAILPFECYIRANSEVTNKYLVLRRGMNTDDTPTGWESVSIPSEKASKVLIDGQLYIIRGNQIYTIQGTLVK